MNYLIIPNSGYLKSCYELNQYIIKKDGENLGLGKLYELGHDYFMKIKHHTNKQKQEIKKSDLSSLFEFSIEPLLKEYLRAEYSEDEIDGKLQKAKEIFTL